MEADTMGMQYVRDAGYDPRECVAFMGKLQDLEQKEGASFTLMSTHPKASDRIANMQTWIAGNFNAATYAGSGGAIVKPDSGYADTWDGADDGSADAYTDDVPTTALLLIRNRLTSQNTSETWRRFSTITMKMDSGHTFSTTKICPGRPLRRWLNTPGKTRKAPIHTTL